MTMTADGLADLRKSFRGELIDGGLVDVIGQWSDAAASTRAAPRQTIGRKRFARHSAGTARGCSR